MPKQTKLFLFLLFSAIELFSQIEYPKNYFRPPIDITPSLSGTFAEPRSGHLHSGIDYRTQGVEGQKIFAIADGFVSRIKISPVGFGKAIYIEHSNGFTSVYAHVRNFNPEIQRYVVTAQYLRESFDLDIYPEANSILVKKGEIIAWSGNSGGSSGPHLHFEIRHTGNQNPVNPVLFGLNIHDNIPPVIQAIKINPANDHTLINGKNQSLTLEVNGSNGNYKINDIQPLNISGDVVFGIQAYDTHNHSDLKNGIATFNISIDNIPVFAYRIDEFAFDDTRYVNAVIDYEEFIRNKRRFIQTRILPNNPLKIYSLAENKGVFSFAEKKIYLVRFEVGDAFGNKSTLLLKVSAMPPSTLPIEKTISENKTKFRFNQVNRFQNSNIRIEIPAHALYNDIWFAYKEEEPEPGTVAKLFYIHDIFTPVHRYFTISMKIENLNRELHKKAVVVRKDDKNEWVSEGGVCKDGFISATSRNFGVFSVIPDTIAPKIKPVNIPKSKSIVQQQSIQLKISDELSGIKSYRGTMNGRWILMDYDAKNDLVSYIIDDRTQKGNNLFKLEVEDKAGNRSVYEVMLVR